MSHLRQFLDALLGRSHRPRKPSQDLPPVIRTAYTKPEPTPQELARLSINSAKQANLDLTRIILRGGLGELKFGMSPEQVIELMGEPESCGAGWFSYDSICLDLYFEETESNGSVLDRLESGNPRVTLCGIPILEQRLTQLVPLLEKHGIAAMGTDSSQWGDWRYFSGKLALFCDGEFPERVRWEMFKEHHQLVYTEAPPIG